MGPFFTTSIQTVERSTVGAAGLSRERPRVMRSAADPPTATKRMRRRRRFFAKSSLTMSISSRRLIARTMPREPERKSLIRQGCVTKIARQRGRYRNEGVRRRTLGNKKGFYGGLDEIDQAS